MILDSSMFRVWIPDDVQKELIAKFDKIESGAHVVLCDWAGEQKRERVRKADRERQLQERVDELERQLGLDEGSWT